MGSSPPSRAEPRENIIEHLGNTVAAITWASRHAPVFSWTFAKARHWQGNSCVRGLCLPSLMLERRLYSPKAADAVDAIGRKLAETVLFMSPLNFSSEGMLILLHTQFGRK